RLPVHQLRERGPRFTIVRDVPYDRPLTTMATFAMCEACAAEYHDPANRRFHAQPTCGRAMNPGIHRGLSARPVRWIRGFIRESGCESGNPSRTRPAWRDESGIPSHLPAA